MSEKREVLQEEVLQLTAELDRLATQHAYSDFWAHCDLTVQQLKLLLVVDRFGSPSMGEAAAAIGSSLSSTTRLVDRLVLDSLVGRAERPGDRRHVFLHLTDQGKELLSQLYAQHQSATRDIVSRLTDDDLENVHRALLSLVKVMHEMVTPEAAAVT